MTTPKASDRVSAAPFSIAGWRVDPASNRLSRGSETVRLEPRAMAVLVYLAGRPRQVVTRAELESAVWAGRVVGYDALSNAIIKLRKAFGDKAREPQFIETISKTGYRLMADVSTGADPGGADRERRLPRRLVAILYADVAGYSRLTSIDEDATHRALSEYLDLISAAIGRNRGQVTHYAGDAVLAMFGAAVDAVACAVDIQGEILARNADRPAERRVEFRIGVNLGDVIEDRGDVYGDGVNVAARLEQLAEPGGIAVSDAVRTAVGTRLPVDFQLTGEHRVKNISEPVRAYRVGTSGSAGGAAPAAGFAPELPNRPSIAVLAFNNMSGDPGQDYFGDGLAEDIITDLSKISGLFVIARNSTFAYKGRQVDLRRLSRDLGVRYVLEGSVRTAGNRLRISAQLIDGTTGGHVWADRFDREMTDVFAVQDEVVRAIVSTLGPTLTASERTRLGQRGTEDEQAYDYFLRGREQDHVDTREANARARALLGKAIERDPGFSLAYSHLSRSCAVCWINRWDDGSEEMLAAADELAGKAVELDESSAHAHFALGAVAVWMRRHELALREATIAIEADPNFADGHACLGMILMYMGEPERAIASLETAMRLDPHYRDAYLHIVGQAYFHARRLHEAVGALTRRLVRKPESDASRALLAAAYGHLGELDKSRTEWRELLRVNPGYSLAHKRETLPYRLDADYAYFEDGLRRAGLP